MYMFLAGMCQRMISGRYTVKVGGATAVMVTFTVIVSVHPWPSET